MNNLLKLFTYFAKRNILAHAHNYYTISNYNNTIKVHKKGERLGTPVKFNALLPFFETILAPCIAKDISIVFKTSFWLESVTLNDAKIAWR